MNRARGALALAAAVTALACFGCGPARAPELAVSAPPTSVPPPPPVPVPEDTEAGSRPPREGLRSCDAIRLDVSVAKLRASRRGAWLAAIFAAEPRLAPTKRKIVPFEVADEARLCGRAPLAWEAVVIRHALPAARVDEALAVYGARIDHGGPFDFGVPGAHASKIRIADDVWTAVVRDHAPHELWLLAPEAARASVTDHPEKAGEEPMPAPLAVRAVVHDPASRFSWAAHELDGVVTLDLGLTLLPDGAARLEGTAVASSPDAAKEVARRMTATIERAAGTFFVRVALRGILSGFSAVAMGDRVKITMPVSAPELDSLLALVAASLGAAPPRPRSVRDLRSADNPAGDRGGRQVIFVKTEPGQGGRAVMPREPKATGIRLASERSEGAIAPTSVGEDVRRPLEVPDEGRRPGEGIGEEHLSPEGLSYAGDSVVKDAP